MYLGSDLCEFGSYEKYGSVYGLALVDLGQYMGFLVKFLKIIKSFFN